MAAVSGKHNETAGETTDYLEIKATGLDWTMLGTDPYNLQRFTGKWTLLRDPKTCFLAFMCTQC